MPRTAASLGPITEKTVPRALRRTKHKRYKRTQLQIRVLSTRRHSDVVLVQCSKLSWRVPVLCLTKLWVL